MFGKKPQAMAFYHEKGFVSAYRQASKFASPTGRVGTMLDVVDARLSQSPYKKLAAHDPSNPTPWDEYYTTMSAEYLGLSRQGCAIIIVAHGVGPMATVDGVLAAYKWEYDDKSRDRRGGRISAEDFLKLESGKYGPVSVVDADGYMLRYQYPFHTYLRASQASVDPLFKARMGEKFAEYASLHREFARKYHATEHGRNIDDPFIIQVSDASNCSYRYRSIEDGYAFAHLLSIGQIVNVGHQSPERVSSWACDVSAHEWWNGVRLIGVREGAVDGIHTGPNARDLLKSKWRDLFEPSGLSNPPSGVHVLMQMPDKTWFTQIEKKGASADTYEPEFRVTTIEKVGKPERFYTSSNYPVPIFRYDRREAQAVLPEGVNAYELVGDPTKTGGADSQETCLVQGYRIEIDHTKRLVRQDVLANNYDRMMQLLEAA